MHFQAHGLQLLRCFCHQIEHQFPGLDAAGFRLVLERPLRLLLLLFGAQGADFLLQGRRGSQVPFKRYVDSCLFRNHLVLSDHGNGRWIWIVGISLPQKTVSIIDLSGLQNHSGSSENSMLVLRQKPNIGPLGDDLYDLMHP